MSFTDAEKRSEYESKLREEGRLWKQRHPEEVAAAQKEYRQNNLPAFAERQKEYYQNLGAAAYLMIVPRRVAKREDVAFTIRGKDIHIPEVCPILGVKLTRKGDGQDKSLNPVLVRIDPELGFIPGNVLVVSARSQRVDEIAKRTGTRTCPMCKQPLSTDKFYQNPNGTFYPYCKDCKNAWKRDFADRNPEAVKQWSKTKHQKVAAEIHLRDAARYRAKRSGRPFEITEDHIVIPEVCPVLGVPLERNAGGKTALPNSPSIDCLIPELGYVPGNINVISYRANSIKNNATLDELEKLYFWCKREIASRQPA